MTQTAMMKIDQMKNDNDLYGAYKEHLEWFNDDEYNKACIRMEAQRQGHKEGLSEGHDIGKADVIQKLITKNMNFDAIAELLEMPKEEVVRLSKVKSTAE